MANFISGLAIAVTDRAWQVEEEAHHLLPHRTAPNEIVRPLDYVDHERLHFRVIKSR
jgi:hypothetical protein